MSEWLRDETSNAVESLSGPLATLVHAGPFKLVDKAYEVDLGHAAKVRAPGALSDYAPHLVNYSTRSTDAYKGGGVK